MAKRLASHRNIKSPPLRCEHCTFGAIPNFCAFHKGIAIDTRTARSSHGHCGPEAKRFDATPAYKSAEETKRLQRIRNGR